MAARVSSGAPAPRPRGRPAKGGQHQPYSLRMPAELHQQLKHYVVDHPGKSLNELIIDAIERWWRSVEDRAKYVRLVEEAAKKRQTTRTRTTG